MKIGLTYNLKTTPAGAVPDHVLPDDAEEEFDSPLTIQAISRVLRDLGHDVVLLEHGRVFLEKTLADPPDFVFNYAEGDGVNRSREGQIPAVLEMLDIPYSGSDPLTMAVTLDKDCAKRLVQSVGVSVPRSDVANSIDALKNVQRKTFNFPILIKPAWEGSSKGIYDRCLVQSETNFLDVFQQIAKHHKQPVMIEEYIEGDEITVGILGNDPPQVFGSMRVRPNSPTKHFVYSLEIKRDFRRLITYDYPPPISPHALDAVHNAALASYKALGCRDVARIDFRMRGDVPYFIEANPIPGLHPEDSDLIIMAKLMGKTYEEVVSCILDAAMRRCFKKKTNQH